jgi:hypothetical protein
MHKAANHPPLYCHSSVDPRLVRELHHLENGLKQICRIDIHAFAVLKNNNKVKLFSTVSSATELWQGGVLDWRTT